MDTGVRRYDEKSRVGWVERSDTHRLRLCSMMGIGAQRLNPSYEEFSQLQKGLKGDLR